MKERFGENLQTLREGGIPVKRKGAPPPPREREPAKAPWQKKKQA